MMVKAPPESSALVADTSKAKAAPFFRFFVRDWWMMTKRLKAAESGILINLLAAMHEDERPLDDNPVRLARLCRTSKSTVERTLAELVSDGVIVRKGGGLWSPYIGAEIEHRQKKSQTNAKNISVRYEKSKEKQSGEPTDVYQSPEYREQTASGGGIKPSPSAETLSSDSDLYDPALRDGLGDHPRAVEGQKIHHKRYGRCTIDIIQSDMVIVLADNGTRHELLYYEGGKIPIEEAPDFDADDVPF